MKKSLQSAGESGAQEILLNLTRQLAVARTVTGNKERLVPLPPVKHALPIKVTSARVCSVRQKDIIISQY